ncbi:hypothetical protein [Vibrio vulnificus]|uniref:hypothetical protein n=1 Tax=Vibrio vulnificus TaxID=672 RepID=UPI0019D41BAF|nr:hypothetical protein [Vibrio vulnificus]MBN8035252.1 hypothetical protein [Vibrio vulnificus]MCU8505682.1 hypothetical protein [Vibrio vulnificus]
MDKILKYAVKEAEDKYGKSRSDRILLPVLFRDGNPDVTYPTNNHIQVTISNSCRSEVFRAYYQLSHEAVHTLSPVSIRQVSWLEEGTAVNFSHCFVKRHCGVKWSSCGSPKYDLAWQHVKDLLNLYPDAIRLIFSNFGGLSNLNQPEVQKLFPRVPNHLIEKLCARFNP